MTRREQAMMLADQGLLQRQIADRMGINRSTVSRHLNHESLGQRRAEIEAESDRRSAPILAAVDAGESYGSIVRRFKLSGRGVVSGIVHRRKAQERRKAKPLSGTTIATLVDCVRRVRRDVLNPVRLAEIDEAERVLVGMMDSSTGA